MKNKSSRIIASVLVFVLLLAYTACGKVNNASDIEAITQEYAESIAQTLEGAAGGGESIGDINKEDIEFAKSGEKGTIDNPYYIGDEINIKGIYGSGSLISTNLEVDFCVEAKVTPSDFNKYHLESNNNRYVELIKYRYKISGDVAGNLDKSELPSVGLLSEKKLKHMIIYFLLMKILIRLLRYMPIMNITHGFRVKMKLNTNMLL